MKYAQPLTAPDNAPYVNADHANGIMGSVPPAASIEDPQRELVNIIKNSQQTPDDGDLMQVTRAIRDGKLNFCIDHGTASAVVVDQLAPSITSYDAGLELRVLIAYTNVAGGTTIQVGDLAPIPIKRLQGTDLQAADLMAGQIADLVCDGTQFQLQNIGIAVQAAGPIDRYEIKIPYIHDTGTANHLIGLYTPALPNINEGRTVEIKAAFNNTGPMDFKPNNFAIHPVAHPDGSPMIAGDVVVNQILLLVFDGTTVVSGYPPGVWQLISSRAAATAVVVTRPKRSLQFMDPTQGWWGTYNGSTVPCLTRLPKVAGNRQVWTLSCFIRWPVIIPRPNFYSSYSYDLREVMFSAGDAGASWGGCRGDVTCIEFAGGDIDTMIAIFLNNAYAASGGYSDPDSVNMGFSPTTHNGTFLWGVLKDTQWHHMLWTYDAVTTQKSAVYLDGVAVTVGPTPASGVTTWNDVRGHAIGCETGCSGAPIGGSAGDGAPTWCGTRARMAEVAFIDGQILTWDKFARNIGGVIVPISDISNLNFGPNGFWLYWADGSAATATTLGKDYSPNGNNFTPFNMSPNRIHADYPGNPDNTESFGAFTNGGAWPTGLPPGWTSTNRP